MLVKIRNDGDNTFAYFVDSRRMIGVNEMGAKILNLIFNQECGVDATSQIVADEYSRPLTMVRADVLEFMSQVNSELDPQRFSLVGQLQTKIPLGAEIEITTDCNLRCGHCLQHNYPKKYMEIGRISEILRILAEAGVFEVSIIGGEPLMHPGIIKILEECNKLEFATDIVTNGIKINEQMAARFAASPHLSVFISIDGTEPIHDRIRGHGTFQKAVRGLRLLLEKNVDVEVLFTLNALNVGVYHEMLEFCKTVGVICNFNLFKPFKAEHAELILNPERFFDVVKDIFELRQAGIYNVGIPNAAIASQLLGRGPCNECRATQSGLVIDVDGRMITCPSLVYAGFYNLEDLPLFSKDFVEMWQHDKTFERFRSDGLRECQARSFIFHRSTTAKDPYGIDAFNDHLKKKTTLIPQGT